MYLDRRHLAHGSAAGFSIHLSVRSHQFRIGTSDKSENLSVKSRRAVDIQIFAYIPHREQVLDAKNLRQAITSTEVIQFIQIQIDDSRLDVPFETVCALPSKVCIN